ncbi:DUF3089 domain-containing protein [Ornithinibacillus sp. JPR2-1]|uniref:alpha/beta hydrolase n=1 Tax=Ornithinibacillus sp. JPR2-1 TaxID=2094019 RepID=UPI0031E24A04
MSEAQFIALQNELFQLFQEGNIARVYPLIEKAEQTFPNRLNKIIFWKACAYATEHKLTDALTVLQEGLAKGIWWNPILLTHDPDLKELQALDEFQTIVSRCKAIVESTKQVATSPLFTYGNVRAEIGLFSLHMRGTNAADFAPYWLDEQTSQDYFFGFPQSSQVFGYNAFCWDNQELMLEDLTRTYAEYKAKGNTTEDILAGGSQGGKLAIELSLKQTFQTKGFIAVIPAIQDLSGFERIIAENSRDTVRGVIITGDQDPFYEKTVQLAELFKQHGIPCKLITIKGLGHFFPSDFTGLLSEAVDYVLDR